MAEKQEPKINMPIKGTPYNHQIEAFNFVCRLFGLARGGDVTISINSTLNSAALLMEM
jgi:hypothetical protein